MHNSHTKKLEELHQVRQKAGEEAKFLSTEINKIQSEINVLVLETRKYESQLQFLTAERDMILQAQMQAQNTKYTPDIQLMTFESADKKR